MDNIFSLDACSVPMCLKCFLRCYCSIIQISGGSGEGAIAAAAWTSGGTACSSKEGQSDFVGMTR